jgi:NitT/TauT family transport system substrate-binding protein
MAIRNIVKEGDPILNKVCRPVTTFDDRLATLLDDMHETMIAADGVGLAGPQVGMLRRLFVVWDTTDAPEEIPADYEYKFIDFVNPEILAVSEEEETAAPLSATEPLRIAGLKGPTTMGLVNLLSMEQAGTAAMDYDLQLYGAADEIVPLLIKGELDMAAIPANLAATLYQKTSGGIQAVAVNTLGVLYVVEQGDTVHSMADLKGRTILSTGKGTTPEYVLRYLLTANGLDPDKDVDIQYYSEATEVTAQMATTQDAIAVLPQPYVTAAGLKDDTLRVALDLTAEWDKVADTQLITGVTVVRKAYAEEHPDVVAAFLADYAQSVNAANTDLDGTAALCEEQGVVAKAAIAKKALPNCNIVCLTGEELKADVSGYLQVLYDADPAAVGGTLPGEDFYWAAQ